MNNTEIYAYTKDAGLTDWLTFLFKEVNAKITVSSNVDELEKLYLEHMPDILLVDSEEHDEGEAKTLEIITKVAHVKTICSTMIVVLSSRASELELKVDYLLNGADYIIEKPLNMVELLARITAMVRHQRHVQTTISDYINQTKNIATFDAMDKILEYLNEHIRPIIQEQIELFGNADIINSESKEDFLLKIKDDALEIMASINAIKDNVHHLLTAHHDENEKKSSYNNLDILFKKNLDLIHMAYDGYSAQKKV